MVRYTRDVSDWALVIRALDVMGEIGLANRIRDVCREPGDRRRSIDATGRDAAALDLATSMADTGRPSHFPPVDRDPTAPQPDDNSVQ